MNSWKRVLDPRRFGLAGIVLLLLISCFPSAAAAADGQENGPAATLTGADGAPVAHTWISLLDIATQQETAVLTDGTGAFTLPAEWGTGSYEAVKYWDDSRKSYIYLNEPFSILEDGTTEPATLSFGAPRDNLLGTVLTAGGDPIQGWLVVEGKSGEAKDQRFELRAGSGGSFAAGLPPGDYVVTSFSDESVGERSVLSQTFTLGSAATTLRVTLPGKNVTGTLKEGDRDIDGVTLSLSNKATGTTYGASVADGAFRLALPDGTYRVSGYWVDGTDEFVALYDQFTVKGQATVSLSVPAKNVTGTLERGEEPVAGAWLNIRTSDYTKTYNVKTSASGGFGLSLPNGSYVVDGYFDPAGGYVRLSMAMDPVDGSADWNVAVPAPNATGTLKKADGTAVDGVTLTLRNTEGERNSYDAQVVNGRFSLYLPNGRYFVGGYWDPEAGETVLLQHYVTVEDGALASGADIVVPVKNVSGTLKNADGEAIGNVWLDVRNATQTENYQVRVDADGSFNVALPDGQYIVFAYYDDTYQNYTRLFQDFAVSGETTWTIVQKDLNVQGTLAPEEGLELSDHLSLHVYQQMEDGSRQGFQIGADNGSFETSLADGHYLVTGYSYESDGETVSVGFFDSFDVSGSTELSIRVPKENVSGTVTQAGEPMADGSVAVAAEGNEGLRYDLPFSNGVLRANLPAGHYRTINVFDRPKQQYYASEIEFDVADGQLTQLPIDLPNLNVHGTVRYPDGAIPRDISFSVYEDTENGFTSSQQIDLVDGEFRTYLADGNYAFSSYYDRAKGHMVQLGEKIRFAVNGESSPEIVLPYENVAGRIQLPVDSDDAPIAFIQDLNDTANRSLYASANGDGSFALAYPDGSYRVTDIYAGSSRWPSRTEFNVVNGVLSTPDGQPLVITAAQDNVHGVVTLADGSPVTGVVMLATPIGDGAYSNEQDVHVTDGAFSAYLTDGSYQVIRVWNEGTQMTEELSNLGIEIVVKDGVASPDPVEIVLPQKNLTGSVVDSQGAPVSGGYVMLQYSDAPGSYRANSASVSAIGVFAKQVEPRTYHPIYYVSAAQETYMLDGRAVVVGDEPVVVPPLQLQPVNVRGTLVDDRGAPVPDGDVTLTKQGGDMTDEVLWTMSMSVRAGNLGAYLADGTYETESYYDNATFARKPLKATFTVANGQVDGGLNLVLHDDNVTGTVTPDENGTTASELRIARMDDDLQESFYATVENGQFHLYLEPGSYTISVWFTNDGGPSVPHYLAHLVAFTVGDDGASVNVDVPLQGSLTNE